jgi:hypothetical protein
MQNAPPVVVFVVVVIGVLAWHASRSRSLLQRWAAENDYTILNSEYRYFSKGPFFWTSSKGQTVYYVSVRDHEGNVRNGWVRCGSWWLGVLSDKTEVRWES